MKVQCQFGHERIDMFEDHVHKRFICLECSQVITSEMIWNKVPEEYKLQMNPINQALQGLLDFEIAAVIKEDGSVFIEYPRRGRN